MLTKLFLIVIIATATFCHAQNRIEDVAFINVGSFTGADEDVVKYFVPRYFKASWHNAKSICQSYGMEFLTLESEAEQNNLLKSLKQHSSLFGVHEWLNIGALTTTCASRDLWYWVDTGDKVNFPLKWGSTDPNCAKDSEPCLALGKYDDGNFWMVDIWCSGRPQKFICKQKNIVYTD